MWLWDHANGNDHVSALLLTTKESKAFKIGVWRGCSSALQLWGGYPKGCHAGRGWLSSCSLALLILLCPLFLCPFSCKAAWSCLAQNRWNCIKQCLLSQFICPFFGDKTALKHFWFDAWEGNKIESLSLACNLQVIFIHRCCDKEGDLLQCSHCYSGTPYSSTSKF